VDFLSKNTTAALDISLESTMPAVTTVNGLVLFIPGIFFSFSQFSSFPSMLSFETWLSLLHQHFPNISYHRPICLQKITTDSHSLAQVNMQIQDDRNVKLQTLSQK